MATNFPYGVMSMGALVGPGGVPLGGTHYFVKPYSGSNANDGRTPETAVKTLLYAHDSLATANKNDVIHLIAEHGVTGTYTSDYLATTLTWSKNMVHLVGENCGNMFSQRSRVAWSSANYDGTATPMIEVSGSNCLFQNIQFWAGVADAQALGCIKLTGNRNVFRNCHIAGIGSDTQDAAGAYDLWFYDSSENLFEDCVIGADTVKRGTAANYGVLFTTAGAGNARNVFRRCIFVAWCESAGNYLFVSANQVNALDRFVLFDGCVFHNTGTSVAGGAVMTQAMQIHAAANGHVILQGGTTFYGAGNVNASDTGLVLCGGGTLVYTGSDVTDLGLALVTTNA